MPMEIPITGVWSTGSGLLYKESRCKLEFLKDNKVNKEEELTKREGLSYKKHLYATSTMNYWKKWTQL